MGEEVNEIHSLRETHLLVLALKVPLESENHLCPQARKHPTPARKQSYNHMELNSANIPNDRGNVFSPSVSRKGHLPASRHLDFGLVRTLGHFTPCLAYGKHSKFSLKPPLSLLPFISIVSGGSPGLECKMGLSSQFGQVGERIDHRKTCSPQTQ